MSDTLSLETAEWQEAIRDVVLQDGSTRAQTLLHSTVAAAKAAGADVPKFVQTPYINTIATADEPAFPGDAALEARISNIVRWNAAMIVTRANKKFNGIGGHMSSYASAATLYDVGFNHFFRGFGADDTSVEGAAAGDQIYFQGHVTPGIYARAYLEGRLSEENLDHFRRETSGVGLSSYPHPWLMPHLWQFPTVSMGLGPLHAIYQARFNQYMHQRGLKNTSQSRVWAYLGDGECDEPETLGALALAGRDILSNLTFVINCNLQRLDGPVRGNGKIIQELEAIFRGAGWNVIKVIWGAEWDPLLAQDHDGRLLRRLNETVDGQFQKYIVEGGAYMRQDLFGKDPVLLSRVAHLSDEALGGLSRGGHAPEKIYAAYHAATQAQGPTCILAKTVKGFHLGRAFEGSNVTHQMKKLDDTQLKVLRDLLDIPLSDKQLEAAPYYHPGVDSPEQHYALNCRAALGGPLPRRAHNTIQVPSDIETCLPQDKTFSEFFLGSKAEVSTTMACVRMLRNLLRDAHVGKHIVPIVPDEARTFGMDAFFREFGIYAAHGQQYVPVDAELLLHYHESKQGQLLEEGITEAGSMASFIAAGTAHTTFGVPMIPFYMFYSMFGLQRTGDQVWSAGDARVRGFLLGATAGRTTLNGEGLQHEDGHSHLLAHAVPNLWAYDPAYAYETAVIVREGMRRMLANNEDVFYYITLYNENYSMPAKPNDAGIDQAILQGMYCCNKGASKKHRVQLLGSGPLLRTALVAQQILQDDYDIGADVWSVTSYQQLYREARSTARYNRLHPEEKPRKAYITQALSIAEGPVIALSDWVAEMPYLLGSFIPKTFVPLGTNGFGRSDTREALRQHFEVDAPSMVTAALYALSQDGRISGKVVAQAMKKLGVEANRLDPMLA